MAGGTLTASPRSKVGGDALDLPVPVADGVEFAAAAARLRRPLHRRAVAFGPAGGGPGAARPRARRGRGGARGGRRPRRARARPRAKGAFSAPSWTAHPWVLHRPFPLDVSSAARGSRPAAWRDEGPLATGRDRPNIYAQCRTRRGAKALRPRFGA